MRVRAVVKLRVRVWVWVRGTGQLGLGYAVMIGGLTAVVIISPKRGVRHARAAYCTLS